MISKGWKGMSLQLTQSQGLSWTKREKSINIIMQKMPKNTGGKQEKDPNERGYHQKAETDYMGQNEHSPEGHQWTQK